MLRTVAAVAALALSLSARATTFSSDTTDLWWNPSESGWGMNIIQQGGIQFITLFVYGANGEATWFVGPDTEYVSAGQDGSATFSGPLYQTTGPVFSTSFNPTAVNAKQVGNVTLVLTTLVSGSLTYSVNGTVVVKQVQRQTWVVDNLGGNYLGAAVGVYSGSCPATGYQEEPASLAVTHNNTAISMTLASASRTCTFTGTYEQDGRMGSDIGSFTCTNGTSGTFGIVEMQGSPIGISMRITTTSSGCAWQSFYAGARRGS
jgi:hypothetical protein